MLLRQERASPFAPYKAATPGPQHSGRCVRLVKLAALYPPQTGITTFLRTVAGQRSYKILVDTQHPSRVLRVVLLINDRPGSLAIEPS